MKRALLVIDVQNVYFTGNMRVTYPKGSLENILRAMDAAKARGVPVIVIQHCSPEGLGPFARGTDSWELHDEIKKRDYDHLIEKNLPGSFTGTRLESLLNELGCAAVTITGYMTQMCCDTTARQAAHIGLSAEFLSDATATLDIINYAGSVSAKELHNAILVTQAMRFSRVMTEKEWEEQL